MATSAWRARFANGFLAGDNDGATASDLASRIGWKVGQLFRRLRVR